MSLADYVARMKEGQDKIYYVTAETFDAAKNSPHLEIFRKKGIEVLLLSDRVDEWVVEFLTEFDGKPLVSVAKGGLDLGELEDEAEKKEQEKQAGEFKELTEKIKKALGEAREGSARHAPPDRFAGLPGGRRARHGRQPRAHAQGRRAEGARNVKPILEINPSHPLVQRLERRSKSTSTTGPRAVRPGAAGRRRAARRSGRLRQADQPADAGDARLDRGCAKRKEFKTVFAAYSFAWVRRILFLPKITIRRPSPRYN